LKGSVYKSIRNPILIVIMTSVSLIAMNYLGFVWHLTNIGNDTLRNWYSAEKVNIQEGNLLSAISKSHRIQLDSGYVRGVALVELIENRLDKLAVYGKLDLGDFRFDNEKSSGTVSHLTGIFEIYSVFGIPDTDLFVVFRIKPEYGQWYLILTFGSIIALVSLFAAILYTILKRASLDQLELINESIDALIDDRLPQASFLEGLPVLQKSWASLQSSFDKMKKKIEQSATEAMIAKSTKMLAHDVRKPFTMLQGTLDLLSSESNPNSMRTLAKGAIPEIGAAINSVNGMIQDVMEVGQETSLLKENYSLQKVILLVLKENLRYGDFDINLEYQLESEQLLNIDTNKVLRIFSNITGNAIQAMGSGTLTFASENTESGMIRISIHNTGSHIPEDVRAQLFEAFYTSGKKGGTGLGLAIAKKITEAHDGQIGCNSSKENGTEFWFTLPASAELDSSAIELPCSAAELKKYLEKATIPLEASSDDSTFEDALVGKASQVKLLVADDELLYRNMIAAQLEQNQEVAALIDTTYVTSGEEVLELTKYHSFDVILMDVDFGAAHLNGFEVVRQIRQKGINSDICICSNRGVLEYGPKAYEAGAQSFLPKPMSRTQLLKILLSSVGGEVSNIDEEKAPNAIKPLRGKRIVLIEDNTTFRSVWEKMGSAGSVTTYESPESFLKAFLVEESSYNDLDAIVVDNNFGDLSNKTGFDLARIIKGLNINCPIAMSSGEDFTSDQLDELFDVHIPKNPKEGIIALEKYLSELPEPLEIEPLELTEGDFGLRHDILNHIIELEILGADLEQDGSDMAAEKILAKVDVLSEYFDYSSLRQVKKRVMDDPASLATWISQVKIDFCSDSRFG